MDEENQEAGFVTEEVNQIIKVRRHVLGLQWK